MIKELENQIRDLKRELAEIQKDQTVLRLQSCRGDSEIRRKDAKFDELDRRAKALNEIIRDMTRKRQLLISESTIREATPTGPKSRGQKNSHFRSQDPVGQPVGVQTSSLAPPEKSMASVIGLSFPWEVVGR